MSASALLLVLAAAVLHAGWNLVVKSSGDRLVAAGVQLSIGAVVCVPFLPFLGVPGRAVPYLVASSLAHLGYVLALVGGYDRADLSVVYPIARGTAPVLVTIGAAIVLDDTPRPWGFAAVGLVVLGVLIVGVRGGGVGVRWGFLTSIFITAYTMIDGAAVRALDESVPYTLAGFVAFAASAVPVVLWRRSMPDIVRAVRVEGRNHAIAAAASIAAYLMVLSAARVAPLGLVSAFRETSVVFGTLGGWLILKEPVGGRRLRGAILIAAGLVALVGAR